MPAYPKALALLKEKVMTTALKPLSQVYTEILASVGYLVDQENFIQKVLPGSDDRSSVIVGGKTLVFPGDNQLAQPDWSKRYAFHPMREDFSSGFSPVFEDYRRRMMFTVGFRGSYLMLSVADMATKDGAYQKGLPPEVADLLSFVKDGDVKFRQLLLDIMAADPTKHKNEMEFVRINVQKGRKIGNEQRKRSVHVSFPILEKVLSHSKTNKVDTIAGVKGVRGVDREMIRSLHKLVFPLAETPEAYTTWSDSLQAPSMDALMRCVSPMIERINELAVTMMQHVPGVAETIISYNWKDVFQNLDAYTPVFNSIPMLNGNTGAGRVMDTHQPVASIPLQSRQQPVGAQPAPAEDRTVTVTQPTATGPVAAPQPIAPAQPVILNPAPIVIHSPSTTFHLDSQPVSTQSVSAFRLDGPRGGAVTPVAQPKPAELATMATTNYHQPTSPQQITAAAQPLFANVQQPVVAPVVANVGGVPQVNAFPNAFAGQVPQLPPGQPTVVNTAAGPIYVYPNGQSFTAQQVQQLQAQAQQMSGMNNLASLGNNPVMQQLLAMNPNNALVAVAASLGGIPGAGVIPGVGAPVGYNAGMTFGQPVVTSNRANGGAYVPLTQVIPNYGNNGMGF